MPKFNVHLFTLVRIKVKNVEAADQKEAVVKAEQRLTDFNDIGQMFSSDSNRGFETEWAEETPEALVDEVEDESFSQSTFYDSINGEWVPTKNKGEMRRHP
jgi:hypothetical protein